MKFVTILLALMASSHAMLLSNIDSKGSLQKRDDSAAYIVVFKKGEAESSYTAHHDWVMLQMSDLKKAGGLQSNGDDQVDFFNIQDFKGYAGHFPSTLLDTIKKNPLVDFVEKDLIVSADEFATQYEAPWGISRISQRLNLNPTQYNYDTQAGSGVTAYVFDTGIKVEHPDFDGRASWGLALAPPHIPEDENGHGTHVAGTLGGRTYGVAKRVQLVAMGVLNSQGKGTVSDILKGIQYVVLAHQGKVTAKVPGYRGAIMNLSFTVSASSALDYAVNSATEAGVHVVVSAGNKGDDACGYSPARASGPITVAATDSNDVKGDYSNYGSCVDVQAPGTNILSAGIHLDSEVSTGTSFAAPHVAGIISTFMSLQPDLNSGYAGGQLIKPRDLKRKFLGFATKDLVTGLDVNSPNVLAYSGGGLSLDDLWNL